MQISSKSNQPNRNSKTFAENAKDVLGIACETIGLVFALVGIYEALSGGKILPLINDHHLNSVSILTNIAQHLDQMPTAGKCAGGGSFIQLGYWLLTSPNTKSKSEEKYQNLTQK